jgi:hypothetical protein
VIASEPKGTETPEGAEMSMARPVTLSSARRIAMRRTPP